ncbi:hypothetical protein ACQXR1_11590 [Bacillus sp. ATD]|uniref:hypothetical protein n=1 Tax=Bacillus sp. ATD TaxID=3422305 RepID=UPI003D33FD38
MKPTITKEQAEAIELCIEVYERQGLKRGNEINAQMLIHHAKVCDGETTPWFGRFECLNQLDIMMLAAALVNGYEVKKTPEEKVREYYEKTKRTRDERHSAGDRGGRQFHNGVLDGIVSTISILGIHIEGVNMH